MTLIPDGTVVRQVIVKPDVAQVPVEVTGQQPCHAVSWRVPTDCNAPSRILPLLETYLVSEDLELPWEFVSRVADVTSEALINAGRYGRPDMDIQITCSVVGSGLQRRCKVQVFNFTLPDVPPFPQAQEIPPPHLGPRLGQICGRGIAIIKARTDHSMFEDLLGHVKQVTMSFDLASHLH